MSFIVMVKQSENGWWVLKSLGLLFDAEHALRLTKGI